MARFHDMLNSLGVGEDGISTAYPDTFQGDITGAYDEDMGVHTAKIGVLETDLAAALSQIDVLKAHNYDLMTQVPTDTALDEEDGDENIDADDNPEDGEKSNLSSIFGDD